MTHFDYLDGLAVLLATLVSAVTPVLARPALERWQVLDVPTARSSHTTVTLRGGGVAPLLGIAAGGAALVVGSPDGSGQVVAIVLATALFAGGIGLLEDVRGLAVPARLGTQAFTGLVASVALGAALDAPFWWIVAAATFVVSYINFTNFMDGVNGISGLHALFAGCFYSLIGLVVGLNWAVVAGLVVAGAFMAFLPWNLRKPGLFLGDVGSYLLGACLAVLAIAIWFSGLPPVVALAPLSIYLADTISTVFRRAWRGEPILKAHRTHVYQRLTETGLSHMAVSVTVVAFSTATGAVGLLVAIAFLSEWVGAMLILGVVATYLCLPRARGNRLPNPRRSLPPFDLPTFARRDAKFAPKKWAVLGATGFIGSTLKEHLLAEGLEVVAIEAPRVKLDPSISDAESIASIAREHGETRRLVASLQTVDVVINAAGLATPDGAATAELYGANALLPAVIASAASAASAGRFVHLSSAAVQGRRRVLDDSMDVAPFSPYSRSKALGERAALLIGASEGPEIVVARATSVQGRGRSTTESLRKIARSPLSTVARPGTQPTVVSSVDGLARFILDLGSFAGPVPRVALQPWEGMSVADVLTAAGGRPPRALPRWVCRVFVSGGRAVGHFVPEIAGLSRRVELMWFGQAQEDGSPFARPRDPDRLSAILAGNQ